MQPEPPEQINVEMVGLPQEVAFDVEKFDQFIRAHGVTMLHHKATRCPIGLIDRHDIRQVHPDHEGCSNGFLYTKAGELTILFNANSKKSTPTDKGVLNGSSAHVSIPTSYDRKSLEEPEVPVSIAPYDRLYLTEPGITVVHWQLFEANQTGFDRLDFPAVKVELLVDADGRWYKCGEHFQIGAQGQIQWTGPKRPGYDPVSGKGQICSIRYTYRPYWYIADMEHEVRVAQVENIYTDEGRKVVRLPQAALIQREYVFEKADRDELAKNPSDARQVKGPASGSFSPR